MTPNSLPGFLRRSIRSVNDDYGYDDHDDHDGDDDDNNNNHGEEIQPTAGSPRQQSLIPPSSRHNNNMSMDAVDAVDAITNANANAKPNAKPNASTDTNQQNDNDDNDNSTRNEKELERDLERLALQVDDDDAIDIDRKFRMVGTPHKLVNSPPNKNIGNDNVNSNANTSIVHQMETNSKVQVLKQNQTPKTNEKVMQPQPQPVQTSKQSSSSSSSSVGQEETNTTATTTMKMPQTKNYKDQQFDKVISSPVVDIAELRNLSWNGIPVSLLPFCTVLVLGLGLGLDIL